jgi:hypothetical protein
MSGARPGAVALLVLGTVTASLGGARLPQADWRIAGAGLAALAAGAALLRRSGRGGAEATGSAGAPGDSAADVALRALRALPARLDALEAEAPSLELPELIRRLSALAAELGDPIAEGSPGLLRRLGTERFAEVLGTYASGERALARAWSAAADQHRPEALAALSAGAARIREARHALDGG